MNLRAKVTSSGCISTALEVRFTRRIFPQYPAMAYLLMKGSLVHQKLLLRPFACQAFSTSTTLVRRFMQFYNI